MKEWPATPAQCSKIVTMCGLFGLDSYAFNLHARAKAVGGGQVPMTVLKAINLYAPQACETCGHWCAAIFGVAGASLARLNGYRGIVISFEPEEQTAALAALVQEAARIESELVQEDRAARLEAVESLPDRA